MIVVQLIFILWQKYFWPSSELISAFAIAQTKMSLEQGQKESYVSSSTLLLYFNLLMQRVARLYTQKQVVPLICPLVCNSL